MIPFIAGRVRVNMELPRYRESGLLVLLLIVVVLLTGCQHNSRDKHSQFYPIGIYAVDSTNDFALIRSAGFNVVTTTLDQPHVSAARSHGLRVLASPWTSAGAHFDAQRARRAVAAFDGHPALWAWYLIDEPDLNDVPPGQVRAAHRFLKRVGATKPTALVIFQGSTALDYANITDIFMIDRYPIPWLPLANFPQHVRMARLALGPAKPLIAVIQAFDWTTYPELLPGRTGFRPPTFEELRCMTYCALARQANGIFYYAYDNGKWRLRSHPEVWQAVKDVVAEVNARLPLFQAEHVWWPYRHDFGDPNSSFNAALESSVTPVLLRVRKGNYVVPAGDYILAVNTTEKTHQYRLRVPKGLASELTVFGEERTVVLRKGWMEDEFGAFAVHIYGPLRTE